MGESIFDDFLERGFIEQVTEEEPVRALLRDENVTCYIGFDPTAPSLHIGSLVPIMALSHMQRAGHRPIALIGGGTALIGDPSGKTEMRKVLTRQQVEENGGEIKKQLARYMDFEDGKALLVNNAEWLCAFNYIEFLRDIGRHFSVNRMLAAESYRMRLETGLNFIEFNYMLLQAYDFLHLEKNYGCTVQMGGNDQWGNIVAGIDLIRRVEGRQAYGITFPLITTALGHKMGKTEKGTVWLDSSLTSPYEYFQYWINIDDADVTRFLALFTYLPMSEIREVKRLTDAKLNMAKAVLAFEATRITHGEPAAVSSWESSQAAFGGRHIEDTILPSSSIPRAPAAMDYSAIPRIVKSRQELERGIPAFELLFEAGLCPSKAEARRIIAQGGAYVNNGQIKSFDEKIGQGHLDGDGKILLRKGKKKYSIIEIK